MHVVSAAKCEALVSMSKVDMAKARKLKHGLSHCIAYGSTAGHQDQAMLDVESACTRYLGQCFNHIRLRLPIIQRLLVILFAVADCIVIAVRLVLNYDFASVFIICVCCIYIYMYIYVYLYFILFYFLCTKIFYSKFVLRREALLR